MTEAKAAETYQAYNHDQGLVPRHSFLGEMDAKQAITGADGSAPVHPGDGPGKHYGASYSLPPDHLPRSLEDEEEGQCRGAGRHGNECCSNYILDLVGGLVVAYGRIGQVVHATDCAASQEACQADSPPTDSAVDAHGKEGEEKHQDGDQQRQHGHASGVGDLKMLAAVKNGNGPVPDEVLFYCAARVSCGVEPGHLGT